jgi:hypothetical protein
VVSIYAVESYAAKHASVEDMKGRTSRGSIGTE